MLVPLLKNVIILLLLCNISILSASDFTISSKDDIWTQIQLHGQNEVCNISVRDFQIHGNQILIDDKNCVSMINSKKQSIICTKKKTICKLDDEILNFTMGISTPSRAIYRKNIFTTTKGTPFKSSVNKHGAVLKSKSFTIYLGKDCDVSSPQFGKGTWEQNNNNFNITFSTGKIVSFANTKAPIKQCSTNSNNTVKLNSKKKIIL